MSARIGRRRMSLSKTSVSALVFFRATMFRATVIGLLIAFFSPGLLAQFDSPPEPLPPPGRAKKETTSTLQELQAKVDEFQQTIAELHKSDPANADRMMREFASSIAVIKRESEQKVPSPAPATTTSKFKKQSSGFEIAKHEIQRIRDLGDAKRADEFAERLSRLESAMAGGEYQLPTTTRPEVHYVKLQSGSTLPEEFRTKPNRFSKSYAEVHLQRTETPVILVLECRVPTLWNLKLADGVEIFAVIVESLDSQKVIGIENPLLLDTQTAVEKQLFDFQTSVSKSRGELFAGGTAVTKYEAQRYEEPIVLGPANSEWRAAFVSDQTAKLVDAARKQRRLLSAKRLQGLRYTASFSTRLDSSIQQFCRGEFDIVGPTANSLVPHLGRTNRYELSIPDGQEVLNFGLSTSGMLVTTEHEDTANQVLAKSTPVPLDPRVFTSRARIRSLAYDSKRHRLLCTTTENSGAIVALDIESGSWSKVGFANCPLIGMAYAPATDEIWAVGVRYDSMQSGVRTEAAAQFMRLSADGEIVKEKVVRRPTGDDVSLPAGYVHGFLDTVANQSLQLIVAGEYAVLTGTRSQWSNNFARTPENYHYVIDADSGELAYDGPVQVHDDQGVINKSRAGFSMLSDVTEMLSDLDSQAASSKLNQTQRDSLGQQLASVRTLLAGDKEDPSEKEKSRAYFVGCYTAGDVKIQVADTSRPITLVLSSTQQVRWDVDIADGVVVEKIIAEGRAKPVVNTSVAGVPVEYLFGNKALQLHGQNRHLHPDRLKKYTAEKLGIDLSVVTMVMRQNKSVVHVGPDDGAVRLQLVHSKLKAIAAEHDAVRRSQVIESLQGLSFFALHRGKLPGMGDEPPVGRTASRVFWNEFAIRGPKIGRSTVAYQSSAFGALDDTGTKLYCADLHRLYIKDLKTGNNESINLRTMARNMGRISGMHFNAPKKQLLIDTQTGVWSFDVATKKPKLLHTKHSQRSNTSIYSPEHKCWYALEQERRSNREVTRIRRYNEHYAAIDQVVLSQAKTRGSHSFSSSYPPQLVVLGNHLAVIDYLQKRGTVRLNGRSMARTNYIGSITVFDAKSGEVVYEGGLEPCVEFRELSLVELQELWQKLSLASEQDAETLMWQMASGGESAFAFLKDKFPKLARDPDVDVEALVKQLDDNRFSVRDRAYRKLRDTGSQIEPDLRAMIQGDATPEVRERLESLIAQWNVGAPQNAKQLQKVRGVEILHRIGNKESRQLLESLANEEQESYVRIQAARSLRGESIMQDGFQNPAVQLQNQLFVPR